MQYGLVTLKFDNNGNPEILIHEETNFQKEFSEEDMAPDNYMYWYYPKEKFSKEEAFEIFRNHILADLKQRRDILNEQIKVLEGESI